MSYWRIKASIYINYFIFAILLNSGGIVIQKSINNYFVSEVEVSSLEVFKDLAIALASFAMGAFFPKINYKKSMLYALGLVFAACLSMFFLNSFIAAQVLFISIGISFALIKVSTYTLIGILTTHSKAHIKLLSTIETIFMLGIAAGYVLFPLFYSTSYPDRWLYTYLLLALLTILSFVFICISDFSILKSKNTSPNTKTSFKATVRLLKHPMISIFALITLMYVMAEQGIMSWLPTFNEKILHLPEDTAVFMSIILVLSMAAGRYLAGIFSKRLNWVYILLICLSCSVIMIVLVLPLTADLEPQKILTINDIPTIAFVFPLIGFFLAPIYPLVNSFVLSSTKSNFHNSMASLLVFFSAIGGAAGAKITGYFFQSIGGNKAFYFSVVPISFLIVLIFLLKRTKSPK